MMGWTCLLTLIYFYPHDLHLHVVGVDFDFSYFTFCINVLEFARQLGNMV